MGFPASGLESFYRNSRNDVKRFFEKNHDSNVKIYNLCQEPNHVYDPDSFSPMKVALMPAIDHCPFPIPLIVNFCLDISFYLLKNANNQAAVHCKAGKGRTGTMIVSYLFFSGICKTIDEAIKHFGVTRTNNGIVVI